MITETRTAKVSVTNPGGNASKEAKRYRLQIPTTWMQAMRVTDDDRDLEMVFDGGKIIIKKA